MTLKLAKNWRFWGIGINVSMGHLSTLTLIRFSGVFKGWFNKFNVSKKRKSASSDTVKGTPDFCKKSLFGVQ